MADPDKKDPGHLASPEAAENAPGRDGPVGGYSEPQVGSDSARNAAPAPPATVISSVPTPVESEAAGTPAESVASSTAKDAAIDAAEDAAESSSSATPKKKRHKTFLGCYTCRRRKIACDLARPTCLKCKRSGFVCEGYDIKLRWSNPLEFDKYGTQLPSKPTQETYCQRRAIDFVKYRDDSAYHLYDEMDRDLAKLQSADIVSTQEDTRILGHFGVFRGTTEGAKHGRKRRRTATAGAVSTGTAGSRPSPAAPVQSAAAASVGGQISRSVGPGVLPPLASNQLGTPNSGTTVGLGSPKKPQSNLSMPPSGSVTPRLMATPTGGSAANSRKMFYPSTPAIAAAGYDEQEHGGASGIGNEWLSNELLDAAMLTASAINGDTHFLDMFQGLDANVPIDQFPKHDDGDADSMLHLLFQGQKPKEGGSAATSVSSALPPQSGVQFSRSDKPISNNSVMIHAGNGAQMPRTIMEILQTTPLPKSLAIDKFGIPTSSLNVHPMTRYLLNYYIEDVADMMTVIPLPKNPWKFIYFPRAIMAVGELASLGRTSNARNALLNALLAVSAFNLQSKFVRGSEEMKYYVNLGIQLRQQATTFLNRCLQEDILKQKYKDVLVAVLSMVTIDVAWGTMSACKIHLDHCERIIEKKMKVKKKLSPKAIVLHRIFSSLKLIQDSTCIDGISPGEVFLNEKNYKRFLTGAKPTPMQLENFFDSHFRDMFRGSRLRMMFAQGPQGALKEGLIPDNDPSMASSMASSPGNGRRGRYNESIGDNGKVRIEFIVNNDDDADSKVPISSSVNEDGIPAFIDITRSSFQPSKNKIDDKVVSSDAIYGLPNSLILMFSEVVHLTKFKRYHDENQMPLPSFFEELAVQLEFKLLTWKLEWKLTEDDESPQVRPTEGEEGAAGGPSEENGNGAKDDNEPDEDKFISPRHQGIYHHVMSFYYGLIIYFYRFVEDVNPLYLQDRIEKVLYHLESIQDILEKHPETSYIIPLFWQGFIAGSEAMTLYLQNGFNLWGQHIAQTGIGTYWNARQIMLEIWRRKNHNVKNNGWVDVLRDWKTNVMLT